MPMAINLTTQPISNNLLPLNTQKQIGGSILKSLTALFSEFCQSTRGLASRKKYSPVSFLRQSLAVHSSIKAFAIAANHYQLATKKL
jgi:hypothetical protein